MNLGLPSINTLHESGVLGTPDTRIRRLTGGYYFIGRVGGLRSGIFVPTAVDIKCDVFAFVMFVSIVVNYKGGRLIKMLWRSSYLFP